MTTTLDAGYCLKLVRKLLMQVEKCSEDDENWREVFRFIDSAERICNEIRPSCLHCGGPNGRSGAYCHDRCRAAHFRQRMPQGTAKSVRRLARGKASIVVHYPPEEADRAVAITVGEAVWLAQAPDE